MPLVVWSTATLETLCSGLTPLICTSSDLLCSWTAWMFLVPSPITGYFVYLEADFTCFFISLFANCPQSQQHVFISPGCLHWHTQVKHLERHHMDIPLSLWTLMHFTFYDIINTVHTVYCSAQTVQLKVLLSFPAVPVSHFFLSGFNEVSVMLMPLQGWQWSFIIILQYRWSFYLSMAP